MNYDVKEKLLTLARQEYESATANDTQPPQRFYSLPGRFIIGRRRISDIKTGAPYAPITLSTHPINLPFPEHSHDFIEIMYVYSGKITHTLKDRRVQLSEGEAIILGLGTHHAIDKAGEFDLGLNIIISLEEYEKLLSELSRNTTRKPEALYSMLKGTGEGYLHIESGRSAVLKSTVDALIFSSLTDTESEPDSQILRCGLSLFLSVVNGIYTERSEPEGKERLLAYIRSSYATATLSEAAELLSLSPSYLSRLSKELLGCSFKQLLMNERFTAATGLLMNTDMPIGDIIATVGYENSSYFHKEFKKRFSMTPRDYRAKNRAHK